MKLLYEFALMIAAALFILVCLVRDMNNHRP